jgi:hypothetical protein
MRERDDGASGALGFGDAAVTGEETHTADDGSDTAR